MKPSTLVILLLALILASFSPSGAQQPSLSPKNELHLFLLVGQSNMAGHGRIGNEDKRSDPRVLMLTKNLRWVPAVAPVHSGNPKGIGVGPGRSFGFAIASTAPGITVGLIPCAVAGSPIDTWTKGAYFSAKECRPWDDAIARARHAMKQGELKGILWHHGESDSNDRKLAESYEKKLNALVARFRNELNAPDVPFIAGQMGQFAERPWSVAMKEVDRASRSLPNKVRNTAFVDSNGLSHGGDEIHFDAKSYRELGRRYAVAYKKLTPR